MKTSEMIAMLEKNPKLRFKKASWQDGSQIGIFNNEIQMLTSFGGTWGFNESDRYKYACEFLSKNYTDWQLIREPVPVWEAIKALTEGKPIKWEPPDGRAVIIMPDFYFSCSGNSLKTGKWYIEDSPDA